MEKGRRILSYIKQYTVGHKFFHLFFILSGIAGYLFLSLNSTHKTPSTIFDKGDNLMYALAKPVLFALWVVIYSSAFLWLFYKEEFDRNIFYDIYHLKQSPFYLISYFSHSDTNKLDTTKYPMTNWKQAKGLMFGYDKSDRLIHLGSSTECNIFVAGSPGSGKTVSMVKPNALCFGGSTLVVDIKGDIYEYTKSNRNIIRFAPDIPDAVKNSAHFNPFERFNQLSPAELKLRVANMAETLIPMDSQKEPYFTVTARKMFCGILLYLLKVCNDLTFPEFLHAILHTKKPSGFKTKQCFPSNIFEWIEMIVYSGYDIAAEQLIGLIGNNEKNISGCFDRLNTALLPLSNPVLDKLLDGKGSCVSAQTLYKGRDVYLQISQNNLSVYAPLFTMIITTFLSDFSSRPDIAFNQNTNRPILCILDEFPRLSFSYDNIDSFLSTLRSKSVVMMLVCQSVAQLVKKYGNDGAQSLLGNITCQVCCKANDEITRNHFVKTIGTKKALKETSGSIETEEPVYPPSKYGNLADTTIVYLDGKHAELYKIISYK